MLYLEPALKNDRHDKLLKPNAGSASWNRSASGWLPRLCWNWRISAPERSVLLALEALEHYPYTWQAERALGQSVLKNRLRQVLNHNGSMQSAAWSADGTKILTGSMDQTVRVWDALNGEELVKIHGGCT